MVEKGAKIDLFVTYVEAQGFVVNLWSQIDFEQYAELETLMKDVDSGQSGDTVTIVDPDSLTVGDVYLAKYSGDGNWYRAQVTEVDKSVGVIKVFFIDFGNTETVSFSSIIKGAAKYFALPPQAAKFRLADISPANCSWSPAEADYLKDKLSNGEFSGIVLEAGTVGLDPTLRVFDPEQDSNIPLVSGFVSDGIGASYDNAHLQKISFGRRGVKIGTDHHVFMSYTTSPFDFWVRQVQAEAGLDELHTLLADYLTSPAGTDACNVDIGDSCLCQYGDTESYYRAIVTNVFKDKSKCQITFIDYGDTEIVNLDCIKVLPAEFAAHPPHAIHCSVSGKAVNTIDFDKLIESDQIYVRVLTHLHSGTHIVTLSEGRSSSAAASPLKPNAAMYSRIQFDVSCFQDVCISDVDNTGHFSVQLVSKAQCLDDLMADLQDINLVPLTNRVVGSPCLVKDSNDGLVYRAEITATSPQQSRVRIVDFHASGVDVVENMQLYAIAPKYAKLQTQATPCSLFGVEDRPPADVSDVLRRYAGKTPLIAKVVFKTSESCEMELYDTRDGCDVKISDIINGNEKATGTSSVASRQPTLPELELRETEKLYVTSILDDATFVGQLSRFPMATLEYFQYELCDLYSTKNVPSLQTPSPGDICCTSFSLDGAFYRGVVQEVCGSKVTVKFIDFGNSEVKEMGEVKVLSSEFRDLPPQGVTCRLCNRYVGLTKENFEAALLEKEITIVIDEKIRSTYLVTLPSCPENRDIVSHLKSFEQAGRSTNDHLESRKAAMKLTSDMDYTPPMVQPHVWSEVVVTLVDDPEHFYCQLTSSEGKLNDLMTEIGDYCCHLGADKGIPGKVVLHMPLIAKYSEDEGWYRARVTGVLASSAGVEVMFVDYGNHEVVTPSAVRTMQPQFMSLPTQAIPCSLAGVKDQGQTVWSQDDTDAFSAIVLEGKYQALFDDALLGVKGQYITDLYDGTTSINAKFLAGVDKLSREFESRRLSQTTPSPVRRDGPVASLGHTEEGIRKPRTTSIAAAMLKSPGDAPTLRYKQPSLPENQYFDLFVAHSISPGQFWCQSASSTGQLDVMMEKLDADYSSLGPAELRPTRLGQSEPCCARYSVDGSWYRALIQSAPSDQEVTVQFVDYGNEERQSVDGIKQLKTEYFELAAQAFHCRLAGVTPPTGSWSAEASAMFEELTINAKIVGCIINKDVTAAIYTVELNKSNGPVHEELIKVGFAISTEAPLQRRLSEGSTASRTSNSSRGSGGRLSSMADEPKYKSLQLKTGQFVDVNISHVTSPMTFWCQLTEMSRDLQQITELLASTYDGLSTSDLELFITTVGRVCCGRFTEDDLWYRGVIIEVDQDRCLVQFVDYGNDEWLPRDRIKQLKSSLAELPTQALQCSLEGISPCGAAWTEEEKQAFEDLTIDKNLLAKLLKRVKGGPSTIKLSLVDDASCTEEQITDELVRRGFAISSHGAMSASPRSPPRRQVEPPVVFTAVKVERGTRHSVAVSWVNSPSDFYCQLERSAGQLSALAENMYKFYDRLGSNELSLTSVSIGQPCVAHYPADGCWYRSCITETISNSKVVVKYVDYGNTETVVTSKVKAITPEFAKLPMQAIGCCLGNMQTPGGSWNKDIVGQFEVLVSEPLALTSVSVSNGIHTVTLTTRNGKNVGEVLLKVLAPPKPEMRTVNVAQAKQAPPVNVSQARQAPPSAKYASSYDCIDLSCHYHPGDKVEVEVAHVESLTKFYTQVVADIPQLDDLMNTMETYYAKPENTAEHPDVAFTVGTACVAQFCEDDFWYRAKVTGVAGDKWTVHFIDYGNSEVTSRSRLRPLPSEFSKLPPQAVECSLADISAVQVQAAVSELSSLALSKRCQVTVKTAIQSTMQVHLQVDGVDINAKFLSTAPGGAVVEFPAPAVPSMGTVDVYVTSVVSLSQFYIQIVANENAVVELAEKITDEYAALPPGDRPVSHLAVGMAVCTMYSVDGAWYRAVVTEVCADKRVSVRFIDYGNVETVDAGDLRSLTSEYLSIPPFCIKCSLVGVQSGDSENIEKFTSHTEGGEKILQAKFLSSVEPCRVTLHDLDVDIAAMFPACEAPEGFISITAPGGEVKVYVSHVESLSEFYVQLVSREAELEGLVESLLTYVQDGQKLESTNIGQACVACFHDDEAWYRAQVTAVSGNDVTVRYVDFGNSSCVSLADDIKDFIDVAHKTPEPFAIQCCLDGVTVPPGGWAVGAKDTLVELTLNEALGVSFQTTSEPCRLAFTDVTIINGIKQTISPEVTGVEQAISPEITGVKQATSQKVTQYPEISVPLEKCQVYVCQVTSPGEVYLQLVKNEAVLNELVDKVDEMYSNLGEERTLKNPAVGTPCCASQAGVWYRAVVCGSSDDGVKVKFVDYGNTDTVDIVKQIDGTLCQMAPLAYQCNLAGVQSTDEKEWPEVASDKLFELTDQKVLTAEFVTSDAVPYTVALWDNTTNISAELVSALPEVEAKAIPQRGESDKELPVGEAGKYPKVVLPSGEQAGFVAAFVNPGDFYVQLSEQEAELSELMASLIAAYDGPDSSSLLLANPAPGGACCMRSSTDDQWYRVVIDSLEDNAATVTLADCGTTETVTTGELRRVLPEFLQQPPFAIHCHLAGLDNTVEWTPDEMGLFLERVLDKDLMVTLERDKKGRIEARLRDGTVDIASLFPGRTTLMAIVEEGDRDTGDTDQPDDKLQTDTSDLVGHKMDVYVSHFVSPARFWCQLVRSEAELTRLSEKLCDTSLDEDWEPSVGALCIIRYKDNSLYRARVLDIDGEVISVFCIDYGNTTSINRKLVFPSIPEWNVASSYALECKLDGISAVSEEGWTEETLHMFSVSVTDKKLLAEFVSTDEIGEGDAPAPSYVVHLWDMGMSVRQRLLDSVENSTEDSFCTAENSEEDEDVGSDATDTASVPDACELPRQGKFEVCLSHVKSPSAFWVQKRSSQAKLKELGDVMQQGYASRTTSDFSVEIGRFCAVKSVEEESWCRARVISVDADNVNVVYVDYGNTETVDVSNVHPLLRKFAALPIQAVVCQLSGVAPSGGSWSDDAIRLFTESTCRRCLIAEVTDITSDDIYVVNLLDMGMSITQKMVDAHVAVDTKTRNAVTLDSSVDDKESEGLRYTCTPLKEGDKFEVHVVSAVSPCNFWSQPAKSSTTELPLLMDKIQDYYSGSKVACEEVGDLSIGMACVAQFSSDENWYRAMITSVNDDDVTVCFVDYGNTEDVPRSKVRVITACFTELPMQAFKCVLSGVSPVGGAWDTASCNRFQEMVVFEESKEFRVEVVTVMTGDILKVSITLWDGQLSIGQQLVDSGYGVEPMPHVAGGEVVTVAERKTLQQLIDKSAYISLDLFVGTEVFAVFVSGESPTEFRLRMTESCSQLEQMIAGIVTADGAVMGERLGVGTACLARSGEDKTWYRALVTATPEDSYEVVFVDYGTRVVVNADAVRPLELEDSLLQIPVQVFSCMLAGIETPNWTPEGRQYFLGVCADKELRASVMSHETDHVYPVFLFDASSATAPTINSLLVERHFAEANGCDKPSNIEDVDILEKSFLELEDEEKDAKSESSEPGEDTAQRPDIETFHQLDFVVGHQVAVHVVSARDPDNIVCQRVDSDNTFQALMTQLAVEYTAEKQAVLENPCVGQPCCVRYTRDGTWRRAQVLAVLDDGVNVYHVDYGKKETVAVTAIRDLHARFLALPAQTTRCCLHRVEPMSLAWADDIQDVLEEACCRESNDGQPLPVTLTVMSTDDDDRIIVDIETCQGNNVREILMDKKLAVVDGQDPEAFDTIPEEGGEGEEGSGEEGTSGNSQEEEGKTEPVALCVEYKPRTLKEGQHCSVFLSHCVNPSQIWCQVGSDDLQVLMDRMQDYYCDADVEAMPSCLMDRDMCCVLSSEDNLWYRAQVESSYEDVYTVLFVDYGHTETTRLTRVRPLVSMFTSQPPFTIQCSLAGVEPLTGDEWSEDAITLLQSLAASPMIMKVVEAPPGGSVRVELTPRSQGASVANTLVAEKYAKRPPRTSVPDKAVVEGQDPSQKADPIVESGDSSEPEGGATSTTVLEDAKDAECETTQNGVGSSTNQEDSGSDAEAPPGGEQGSLELMEHHDDDAAVVSGGDASCVGSDALCGASSVPDGTTDTTNDVVDISEDVTDAPSAATNTADGASDTPSGAVNKSGSDGNMPSGASVIAVSNEKNKISAPDTKHTEGAGDNLN